MSEIRDYLVTVEGDLDDVPVGGFDTLRHALMYVFDRYSGPPDEDGSIPTPDPEDDRILVWERTTSGHAKVVWHFSGWHYPSKYENLDGSVVEQGALPEHNKPLYIIAMEQY